MTTGAILRLGSLKNVERFQAHAQALDLQIPCDSQIVTGAQSPLRWPLNRGPFRIGNRIAVQPMEGWDATPDGAPSENTVRRWQRFGRSGAKLIWGGEAVAVSHEGRANPNQLLAAPRTQAALANLRDVLRREHILTTGSDDGLVVGLQLTHSGRYCRPNEHSRPEPRILYHHPFLDQRLKLPPDYPLLTDGEIESIIEDFHRAALMAWKLGFDFVDIKHCHGYLGHEFLSAHTREGHYGGTLRRPHALSSRGCAKAFARSVRDCISECGCRRSTPFHSTVTQVRASTGNLPLELQRRAQTYFLTVGGLA